MFRILIVILSVLFSTPAFAQVVGQGTPGDASRPWFVTGTVTFDNTTINLGAAIPTGDNNIGNVDIVSFPDNEPINIAQINGVAVTMGNGASGTGVQRVTIASDSTGQVAIASLPNEGAQTMANSISVAPATDGVFQVKGQNGIVPIFCTSTAFLNMTTATTTEIKALSASTHIYVCSYMIHIRSAVDVKFVSGTGTNCATSQADVSTNYDFDNADVGVNRTAGGGSIVTRTNDAGDALCVTSSAATDVDVEISYVQF